MGRSEAAARLGGFWTLARLLLAGYFGCGNLGDDAILVGFAEGLASRHDEVVVLSGSPEDTFRNYKLSSVPRRDMGAVDKAIKECDALVFPGGSIFQDVTSVKSAYYYSSLVTRAKKAGKKVVFLGQGVGPVTSFFGKRWTAAAFQAADGIAVRDPASMATLKELGVTKPIKVTADLAFLMPRPEESDEEIGFQVGSMKTVGISARPHGKGSEIVDLFGEFARLLFKANYLPVLIEMDHEQDGPLILEISKKQGGKIPDLRKQGRPQQIANRLSRMDAVVAMRLHAGILAANVGIPPLMVSYDPKVTAFAKLLGTGSALDMNGLTPARLFDAFQTSQKDKERNIVVLEKKRAELAELAKANFEILDVALRRAA